MAGRRLLGEILVETGAVTPEQVQRALQLGQKKKVRVGEALVSLGFCDPEKVARALCKQNSLPFVNLETAKAAPSREILEAVPRELVEELRVVPVARKGGSLLVAMDDPLQLAALDALRFRAGVEAAAVLTTPEGLKKALFDYYGIGEPRTASEGGGAQADLDGEEGPVVRLVEAIIADALRNRASDIHVEPFGTRVRVRYRIDGYCQEVDGPPKDLQGPLTSRLKLMARMDIAEKRKPQDGRIVIEVEGREIDLRVSVMPAYHGESIVMRILDKERGLVGLKELGFDGEDHQRFSRLIKRPNGLFLVTGPTGSGKTTTLYAALRELNRPDVKILTAEDPVEYYLSGINQCQVRAGIGLTFARILRSMLRQAPNIILVGEIRDVETAEIAIQASLTGHLVFSTLHTNDAPSALTRLVDMGVKPFLVSTAVMSVMAQRLVRKLCPKCRVPKEPTPSEMRAVGLTPSMLEGHVVYAAEGCDDCRGVGYRGRIGLFELFEMDPRMRELCFKGTGTLRLREQARLSGGLVSLQEDGVRKVLAGLTTIDEVLAATAEGSQAD
ncbi:MAG: Flp pilus assembly complex ATPase component TadA [Planctomycetaceae bacterium]|nr:Flp pilus assembly complex ATPase component TadA [Planctomycetota bacterium]NUN52431.1 Flp pilus assembly complex ATPase component TadA [Planctomycetaceae bacterium]